MDDEDFCKFSRGYELGFKVLRMVFRIEFKDSEAVIGIVVIYVY